MKTSNKLLLVFLLAGFFSAASLMVYAKSHMYEGTPNSDDLYYGKGPIIEKTMLDDLTANIIEMGDNFRYLIDPSRTDVTIKGDSAFIEQLTIVHNDEFRILTGGVSRNYDWPDNLYVIIGVKNLKSLNFDINGNADVTASEPLSYDVAEFRLEGNARCLLDLTVKQLDVISNGNGRMTLNGSSNSLMVKSNGNCKLNFENFGMETARLDLNGNARFYGDIATSLDAHANGNAKITFNDIIQNQEISTNGNGKITIRN